MDVIITLLLDRCDGLNFLSTSHRLCAKSFSTVIGMAMHWPIKAPFYVAQQYSTIQVFIVLNFYFILFKFNDTHSL